MNDHYSEDIQEILGTPPPGLIFWGVGLLALSLTCLLLFGWFFQVPEKVEGDLILTTPKPPVPIITPQGGYLERVLVQDGQEVEAGTLLAELENQASLEQVLELERKVDELLNLEERASVRFDAARYTQLGELRTAFSNFLSVWQKFALSNQASYNRSAVRGIVSQVELQEKKIASLNHLKGKLQEDLDLARKNFEALQKQYESASAEELENLLPRLKQAKQDVIELEQEIRKTEVSISENEQRLNQLKLDMLQLRLGSESGKSTNLLQLQERLNNLKAAIEQWKQQYLLISPVAGTVHFFNNLRSRQYIEKGQTIMAIVPPQEAGNFIGEVYLPIRGSGKVRPGQKVQVRFERYPAREYGHVIGVVQRSSLLPIDGTYFVEVVFPNGLKTNKGKELEFRLQMPGKAEIITDNRRLIRRIF
ncbi:MAG: HlyD family efflux transporter periplasmic adaptor subunit [Bacteroidetes bacterium]|nr:MAG: HlyD family efflux transporter periplasmic adaptor subunit [Bacteroidota bacterium]